ncbi:hypothetical protein WCX18_04740 [Sulfurimonas sp. HSL1-2]|uniref:hypothetical protein n=1 Tax=Thiomicrolovo zhangzhouensis TaxID=3131933 RepID=UPI0031F8EF71
MKKQLLRAFGLLGVILFVPLFLLTFSDPHTIEKSASGFIEWKLKNDVDTKIDAIRWPQSQTLKTLLGTKAEAFNLQADAKLAAYKQMLKNDVPAILAEQLFKLRNLDCECRKKWEERLTNYIAFEIATAEKAKEKLADFMQAKYMAIVAKLTLDVRIFLGINALVFILLLTVSFLKPEATEHLFFPGVLLLLSSAICSYFYLFEQNWFYTILYNDYTGFGYLVYLLAVFAMLCDIAFNRARITTEIINAMASAVGSAFSVVPC